MKRTDYSTEQNGTELNSIDNGFIYGDTTEQWTIIGLPKTSVPLCYVCSHIINT